jgi:type I restriction enzyme M protein
VEAARSEAVEALRKARYFVRQADWLQERFPNATLRDVEGLVKLVDRSAIVAQDSSLTPGRYVGVAPEQQDAMTGSSACLHHAAITSARVSSWRA